MTTKLFCEKLAKPRITAEFMTFWLHKFRKLDTTKQEHKKALIDTFINAIYLYDDRLLLTFNFKEGEKTITFDDVNTALENEKNGSDLDYIGSP